MGKRAAFFWLLGLIFSLAGVVISMIEVARESEQLRIEQANPSVALDDRQLSLLRDKRNSLRKRKFENTLNLLKNLGDSVTASQALSLPKKVLGFDFNDGQVGFGGLLSAVITCYQLYPEKK